MFRFIYVIEDKLFRYVANIDIFKVINEYFYQFSTIYLVTEANRNLNLTFGRKGSNFSRVTYFHHSDVVVSITQNYLLSFNVIDYISAT